MLVAPGQPLSIIEHCEGCCQAERQKEVEASHLDHRAVAPGAGLRGKLWSCDFRQWGQGQSRFNCFFLFLQPEPEGLQSVKAV